MRFTLGCAFLVALGLTACAPQTPASDTASANNVAVARCGSVTGSKLKTKDACSNSEMDPNQRETMRQMGIPRGGPTAQ